jgi:hypothetical protein
MEVALIVVKMALVIAEHHSYYVSRLELVHRILRLVSKNWGKTLPRLDAI